MTGPGRALTVSGLTATPPTPTRERDTQALLSRTQAMELRQRDYHVDRPLLNQEQLEELGSRSPAPVTLQWRTWFR